MFSALDFTAEKMSRKVVVLQLRFFLRAFWLPIIPLNFWLQIRNRRT